MYLWRIGMLATKRTASGYWHAPARVVMTEQPSTLWLSYQGTLVKASPERVRRAAEEEQLTLTGWIDSILNTKRRIELGLLSDPFASFGG